MENTSLDTQLTTIKTKLEKMSGEFSKALPKISGLDVDNFIKVSLTTLRKNPALLKCTEASLFTSLMQAAQLGLPVDPALGQAYLVPFGKECTLIVGYRGFISICHRYGDVRNIHAEIIYSEDEFKYKLGLNPELDHIPTLEANRGKPLAAYAIIDFNDGSKHFKVIHGADIEKAQAVSKTDKIWKLWPDEMWKKTAVRRIFKDVPLSIAMGSKVAEAEGFIDMPVIDVEASDVSTEQSRTEKLKADLTGNPEPPRVNTNDNNGLTTKEGAEPPTPEETKRSTPETVNEGTGEITEPSKQTCKYHGPWNGDGECPDCEEPPKETPTEKKARIKAEKEKKKAESKESPQKIRDRVAGFIKDHEELHDELKKLFTNVLPEIANVNAYLIFDNLSTPECIPDTDIKLLDDVITGSKMYKKS